MNLTPVIDEGIAKHHTLREEERHSRSLVPESEKSKLSAELSVVTLLCLLDRLKVSVKLSLLCESGCIDTLEHLVLFASTPVCARCRGQLERLDPACIGNVRACAKLGELALLVEADVFALVGVLLDKLNLVDFALVLIVFYRFVGSHFKFIKRKLFLDNLLHLRLNLFKIFGEERLLNVKIIIEAVCNRGAYRKLSFGIKSFDCLSHNMRCGVTEGLFSLLIVLKGKKFKLAVALNRSSEILIFSVYFADTNCLVKSHADAFCNFHGGCAVLVLLDNSAFQSYICHFCSS